MIDLAFRHDSGYILSVKDNGSVAYAFLVNNNKIVGYTWLYNREVGPEIISESFRGQFLLNARPNVKPDACLPNSDKDIRVLWQYSPQDAILEAGVYINNHLIAKVGDGDKPGFCFNAAVDSILAFCYE